MTKKKNNRTTTECYLEVYQADKCCSIKKDLGALRGYHMKEQKNKFLCFFVKICTVIVLIWSWQYPDEVGCYDI